MKVIKLKKLALALGSLVVMGASTQAFADGAPFTVMPSSIPGTPNTYDGLVGVAFTGSSSELLHNTDPGHADNVTSGSGYFTAGSLVGPTGAYASNVSGLSFYYGIYLKFTLSANGALATNQSQQLTQLDFTVYADPGAHDTFTAANTSGGLGTEAMVTDVGGNDIVLGSGHLLVGTAGVDSLNGLYVNSTQSFSLTAAGSSFFVSPVPFYTLAFDAFNNTSQNITPNADGTVAVNAAGTVDFNNVPEPSTLALFGIAALGLGLSARTRTRKQ